MSIKEDFLTCIKAGAKIVQIISYETQRVQGLVAEVAQELNRSWYTWNRIEGTKKWGSNGFDEANDDYRNTESVLEFFQEEENLILILEDFHPDLREDHVETIQRLRNIALNSTSNKTIIIVQPYLYLPRELEKEVQLIELPYPDKEDLRVIFQQVCQEYELQVSQIEESNTLLESALGLTIMEARIAFGKAIVQNNQLMEAEIPVIVGEKESVIKKSGYLEYYHPKEGLDDVGGLDRLKDWLRRRGKAFGLGARDFGLDTPRGILLLGLPGTGKSLSAKAVASAWKFPLLRLDMGKIYGGIVGQSEENIRGALHIAEAISPCVLWIDEIEKGLSGSQSSGQTDGGTTSRVLGTFLTWMQEKTKPVFVVATANDISQLPPELLRKGRMDEIFFVDLPTQKAREDILAIHLKRKKRVPEDFNISQLAEISKGYTGAELEEAVKEGLFKAYDRGEDVTSDDLEKAIQATYPLSRTMGEVIQNLRKWQESRAVSASSDDPEPLNIKKNKDAPRLKQESSNPFIKD